MPSASHLPSLAFTHLHSNSHILNLPNPVHADFSLSPSHSLSLSWLCHCRWLQPHLPKTSSISVLLSLSTLGTSTRSSWELSLTRLHEGIRCHLPFCVVPRIPTNCVTGAFLTWLKCRGSGCEKSQITLCFYRFPLSDSSVLLCSIGWAMEMGNPNVSLRTF